MLVNVPCLDALLEQYAVVLGKDFAAYRNHTYRVTNFYCLPSGGQAELEKVAIAAAHHDIGIWTARSFDYLAPSTHVATEHLISINRTEWSAEVGAMICNHHKITACSDTPASIETFRRADWIDVSGGMFRFGLPRHAVSQVMDMFPNAGFHRLLFKLAANRLAQHPLSPLPMLRW